MNFAILELLAQLKILACRLMRTISFNSVEDELGCVYGCSEDIKKGRVSDLHSCTSSLVFQIRNLITQIREYGVSEDLLFNETDLLFMKNIPKVSKCLKEIATIVSARLLHFWHERRHLPVDEVTGVKPERSCHCFR